MGCGGSATSANGTFFTNVGTFQVNGTDLAPGNTPFNFSPYNYYQRPDERYTLGAFADYEISSGFKPYLEAMFMDDRSVGVVTSGNFSPVLGHGIALALVSPDVVEGAAVSIDVRGSRLAGTVVPTPFVRH